MLKKHRIAVCQDQLMGIVQKIYPSWFRTESIERIEQALVLIAKEISLKN